jgi:hypothetical protein
LAGIRSSGNPLVFEISWSDFEEDTMMNPAPGFWPSFGPLGPRRAPGAPRMALARKIMQVAPKGNPGNQLQVPFFGAQCFWDRPQKYKEQLIDLRPLKVRPSIFDFALGPPLPVGVPGERPDGHVPSTIGGLGPAPARIRRAWYIFNLLLARSTARVARVMDRTGRPIDEQIN